MLMVSDENVLIVLGYVILCNTNMWFDYSADLGVLWSLDKQGRVDTNIDIGLSSVTDRKAKSPSSAQTLYTQYHGEMVIQNGNGNKSFNPDTMQWSATRTYKLVTLEGLHNSYETRSPNTPVPAKYPDCWVWVYWCFTSHATIFQSFMWRHRCAGRLKKKLSGFQRHRNFAGFFNVYTRPTPTRDHPFYTVIPTHRPIYSPFPTRWGHGGRILDLTSPPPPPPASSRGKYPMTAFIYRWSFLLTAVRRPLLFTFSNSS